MSNRFLRTAGLACLALAMSANMAAAAADSAQTAFDNGNAAFRAGDYSGALASYSEALANGKEEPRLFYNMGLAHLRLGQLAEARWAFSTSAKSDSLAALSYYHLGVIAQRNEDPELAETWFRKARRAAKSEKLREMSTDALETVGAPQSEFRGRVSVGAGFDSNAFRAPREPYVDYSQDVPALVVPDEQSGAYVPVRIAARYANPVARRMSVVASYRHRGDYYIDGDVGNADETDHRVELGLRRFLDADRSSRRMVEGTVSLRTHGETNFDRDDGLERFDDGANISARFDYTGLGAEIVLRNRIGSFRYELEGGLAGRDFEDVPTASSYDLSDAWMRAALKFPVGAQSRLEVGYGFRARNFDERRSRDLSGETSLLNPTVEYRYYVAEVGLRHRFTDRAVAELVYSHTKRDDLFVGYNDYTRDRIELETAIEISDKLSISFDVDYRDQSYPRAFAFNDPSQAAKDYQDLEFSAGAVYRLTSGFALRLDVRQDSVDSSDLRGAYDRTRVRMGVDWEF